MHCWNHQSQSESESQIDFVTVSGGANTSSTPMSLTSPAPSVAPAPPEAQAEEDLEAERLLLGLEAADVGGDKGGRKRRSGQGLAGPKIKRSREEIFEEQLLSTKAKWNELVESLREPSLPSSQVINGVMRLIQKKLAEAKTNGAFSSISELETLQKNCMNLKEGVRLCGLYIPASGIPNTRHEDSFAAAISNMGPNLIKHLNASIKGH